MTEEQKKFNNAALPEGQSKFSLLLFCSETCSLLLMAYIFVIFCIYPFYMQNGYVDIGKNKFFFYRNITIGAFVLIIPLVLLFHFLKWQSKRKFSLPKNISFTDIFVLIYTFAVFISYFLSDFQSVALWGEEGWYMGLLTQVLFILTYFLITRYWEFNIFIIYAFLGTSSMVFILGILNRFSIFPFYIEGQSNGFLSTLGNINWYSGFWAVSFPIGFFLYWSCKKMGQRFLLGIYCMLALATGISQGSNSAFIVFIGIYLMGFTVSFSSFPKMRRFFELCAFFFLSCQLMRGYRYLKPDSFDYYSNSLSNRLTLSSITLYALIAVIFIYIVLLILEKKKEQDINKYRMIRQITLLLCFLCIGIYILLLILNSNVQGGIRFMAEQSALTFGKYWGSSRGGTWSAGALAFTHMNPTQKLFGVGPDCFAMYIYTVKSVAALVNDQFENLRLTNAHFEWLTVLVNNGLVGLLGYAGIFISIILRFLYRGFKKSNNSTGILVAVAACAFSYSIHNIVSFQQILSTPFVFIIISIGERFIREEKSTSLTNISLTN